MKPLELEAKVFNNPICRATLLGVHDKLHFQKKLLTTGF